MHAFQIRRLRTIDSTSARPDSGHFDSYIRGQLTIVYARMDEPDAVTIMLPEDSSLPTDALVFIMTNEPYLIAK